MGNVQKTIKKVKEQDFSSLAIVGRNLVGLSFVVFGLSHIIGAQMLIYYVPFFIPFKVIWIVLSGVIFIFGGALLILQKHVYETAVYLSWFLGALSVFAYLIPFSLVGIFSNVALIGALLLIADRYDKNDKGIVHLVKSVFR